MIVYAEITTSHLEITGMSAADVTAAINKVWGNAGCWDRSEDFISMNRSEALQFLAHQNFVPVSENFFYKIIEKPPPPKRDDDCECNPMRLESKPRPPPCGKKNCKNLKS